MTGCAPHSAAPIVSREPPPPNRIDFHEVSKGDTLYSIAWRYELDYQKLARANGILPPYTIHAGQRLTLDLSKANMMPVPLRNSPSYSSHKKPEVKKQTEKTVVVQRPAPKAPAQEQKPAPAVTAARSLPKTWTWRWPASGKVERYYDAGKAFKGIYIHSGKGSAVSAAAPGVVVYAGSGLRGYGRLIIVKHSDVYLSAYAHNRRILVKEGQVLNSGQKIAEVGGDIENPNRLYFEIRRDGKSVDPTGLLP